MALEKTDASLSDGLEALAAEFKFRLARLIEDALVEARNEGFEEGYDLGLAEGRGET